MALLVLFASLSSRRFKSSSDNVANLDFDSAMTKLIKLLVSVVGDVTSACIKLLSVGMTSLLHKGPLDQKTRMTTSTSFFCFFLFRSAHAQNRKLLLVVVHRLPIKRSLYIKSIVCMYDARETEQARISCMLMANQ